MMRRMRKLALGIAVLPTIIGGGVAFASSPANPTAIDAVARPVAAPFGRGWLSDVYGTRARTAPVIQVAQADDPRLQELEEEIRKLTGKIEDLNFQVLQMQDQMQKMQQDNEFRFQELEKGGTPTKKSDAGPARSDRSTADAVPAPRRQQPEQSAGNQTTLGAPPRPLGSMDVDANGDVVGASINSNPSSTPLPPPDTGAKVAALPQTDDPNVLYKQGYDLALSGDYASAEAAFRAHIKRYPADPQTADARYWLGESLYGQGHYSEAAQVFLDTHRDYPKARTAAEDLLKLGMSLGRLGNHNVACATFKEVLAQYPKASAAVRDKVAGEQAHNGC